ncbi:MAG TPA: hypothetical protein VEC09_02800 [Actinomycetota bacterium]|nr:hypothetical protein [Actinomycetota bacterium]
MKSTRALAASLGATIVVGVAAITTAAVADDGQTTPSRERRISYTEPSQAVPPAGTYVGYVRRTASNATTVAVDFVGTDGRRVENNQPEITIDGRPIVDVDLFGLTAKPFKIVIDDGTIVQVETTDAIPPLGRAAQRAARRIVDWLFDDEGNLSVDIDGRRFPVPGWVADALGAAITSDTADRGDDGERTDVTKWLEEHPSVADAVADVAVFGDGAGRIDLEQWIAEHPTVSDAEWWDLERRALREVLENLR